MWLSSNNFEYIKGIKLEVSGWGLGMLYSDIQKVTYKMPLLGLIIAFILDLFNRTFLLQWTSLQILLTLGYCSECMCNSS